jgi:hypothetical protein
MLCGSIGLNHAESLVESGEVVVFPRQTLFEQSHDVTQLQVSGHEVLGWWVVAREAMHFIGNQDFFVLL